MVVNDIGIGKLEIEEALLLALEQRTSVPSSLVEHDSDVAWNAEGANVAF